MRILLHLGVAGLLIACAFFVAGATAGTTQYSYDELGRLRAVIPSAGAVITYNYDAAGNRTQVSRGGGAPFSDPLAMTVGAWVTGPVVLRGYKPGYMGSLVPTTLTGGKNVVEFYENWVNNGVTFQYTILRLSGFTSNPGASWLASVKCGGVTRTGASASSFGYSSGSATWQWNAPSFSTIGFYNQGGLTCTFVHG